MYTVLVEIRPERVEESTKRCATHGRAETENTRSTVHVHVSRRTPLGTNAFLNYRRFDTDLAPNIKTHTIRVPKEK